MEGDERLMQLTAEAELLRQQVQEQRALRTDLELRLAASRAALDQARIASAELVTLRRSAAVRLAAGAKHPVRFAIGEVRSKRRGTGSSELSELFDAEYYRWAYPDAAGTDEEVWGHYRRIGAVEGRNPSALFDVSWYRATYPDVVEAGLDPVTHWLQFGANEGRDPHPLFSCRWYLDQNPDVEAAGANPLLHFLRFGAGELRDPNEFFDIGWYLEAYPDIAISGRNPLVDYLMDGAGQGRNPNPNFYSTWYLSQYPDAVRSGLNPLVHYVLHGRRMGRPTTPSGYVPMVAPRKRSPRSRAGARDLPSAQDLIDERWPALRPLRSYTGHGPGRIVVVTDSISRDSLFGGVATSLILAALWAKNSGRGLRIVTRTAVADPEGFALVLGAAGIVVNDNPDFVFHGPDEQDFLDVRPDDVFLTTSWWTTSAFRAAVDPRHVVYLLQEDERLFYPSGDDWARAEAEMTDPRSLVIVNSQRLYDYLLAHGCPNLAERGHWFDPSFAAFTGLRDRRPVRGVKRELFFYSRPNNPRNLFYLGLQALNTAFETGALDPDDWIVHFVGPGSPPLTLDGSVEVQVHQGLNWVEYSELLPRIDVALSLMATPHSSYPPLDLATSGAWVVTNTWPGKESLQEGGPQLLAVEANAEALVAGLARAARGSVAGAAKFDHVKVEAGWPDQLSSTVSRLMEEFGGV